MCRGICIRFKNYQSINNLTRYSLHPINIVLNAIEDPIYNFSTNTMGLMNLLEACKFIRVNHYRNK